MNKALILVMCDVLVLSAMSLSNGGFGDGLERRRGRIDVTQEFNVAKDALKKTEEALKASELRLQQRARELADVQAQKRRDDDAHKGELAEMSARLKVAMMSEAEHRKAIDDTCVAVTVKNKDGREDRKFYSPLIDINGNTYVMVYMYKKKELENMSAIFVQGRSGEWDEVRQPPAYYIDDCNQELNIVLFELKGNHSSNRLTLGKRTGGTLQFWVSRDTGLVWRPQGTSITEKASDWWQQKRRYGCGRNGTIYNLDLDKVW